MNCTGPGASPITILDIALASSSPADSYDISLVDGFNLPVELKTSTACPTVGCPTDFNPWCPNDARGVIGSDGSTLACKNEEKYWDAFAKGCPKVYIKATAGGNSASASQQCPGSNSADYTITFCPSDTVVFNGGSESTPPSSTIPTTGTTTSTTNRTTTTTSSSSSNSFSNISPTTTTSGQSATSPTEITSLAVTATNNNTTAGAEVGNTTPHNALSSGAIAGITLGVIIGVSCLLVFLFFCLRQRRGERDEDLNSVYTFTGPTMGRFTDLPPRRAGRRTDTIQSGDSHHLLLIIADKQPSLTDSRQTKTSPPSYSSTSSVIFRRFFEEGRIGEDLDLSSEYSRM